MKKNRRKYVICMSLMLAACTQHPSDWDNIDYSRIARDNQRRENDRNYVPTVIGCADDDLYNCK